MVFTARLATLALLTATLALAARPAGAQVRENGVGATLWIGNSLVRYPAAGPYPAYDLPEIVEHMRATALAARRPVSRADEVRVLAQDGFGMEGWWHSWHGYTRADGEQVSAARAIVEDPHAARSYDPRLGFQPLPPRPRGWARIICLSLVNVLDEDEHWHRGRELVPAMERWYRFIREHQPRAEILHYAAPADSRKVGQRQVRIDELHAEMRARHGGRVVPVGRAFVRSMRGRRHLELRRPSNDDFVHYSGAGAYLAAAVFYAVLHGDPTGLGPPAALGVSEADASFLQTIARDTVVASAPAR